jgi:hypothetical protein
MGCEHIVFESLEIKGESYWVRAGYARTIVPEVTVLAVHVEAKESWDVNRLCLQDGDKFKYAFFSIGACRRGFKACRPVIALDGAFLKTKYGGQLLCAIAMDANSQLYPLAFGVVDSECHASWIWFLRRLREAIGEDVPNLAFKSDRHVSIIHVVEVVFPGIPHGACYHHLQLNVQHKFKTDHCRFELYDAAYAFSKTAFEANFRQLRRKDVEMAKYLEEVGVDRWARAFFPGKW